MILAFHSIFTTYGTWLPNEPRGSWSDFVASWELFQFGRATKVDTRRSVAHREFDRDLKKKMQAALQHDPVKLTGEQAKATATSFTESPYAIHALAILPNHVHAVIGRTDRSIRSAVGHIKSNATRYLRAKGWFLDHTPWARRGWNVYLNTMQNVQRAIRYVRNNPMREGLKPQTWSCVQPIG